MREEGKKFRSEGKKLKDDNIEEMKEEEEDEMMES